MKNKELLNKFNLELKNSTIERTIYSVHFNSTKSIFIILEIFDRHFDEKFDEKYEYILGYEILIYDITANEKTICYMSKDMLSELCSFGQFPNTFNHHSFEINYKII